MQRYEIAREGSSVRTAGAAIAIAAPIDCVRNVILDFAHYSEFLPQFTKSRVLSKGPSGTDVYLEAPIRFVGPTTEVAGEERIAGHRQSESNLDQFEAVWRLSAIDDSHTMLRLELLLVPKLPIPASALNGELQQATARAIMAARARAERVAGNTPAP
jgi:ribosome-associated toxin RatA of RatAB toxin-antitoxin module